MIDQRQFFHRTEMIDREYSGDTYYEGRNGKWFRLEQTNERVVLEESDPEVLNWRELLILERVIPDEDLAEMLHASFQQYLLHGDEYLKEHNSYYAMAEVVRAALGTELDEQQLMNLCNLYYRSIRYGRQAIRLTDTCKEVIRMLSMPQGTYVPAEVHRLLLQVPDAYYDFVRGMEGNLKEDPERIERCWNYMKKYPNCTTNELIIMCSLLNGGSDYSDERMHRLAEEVIEDEGFQACPQDHWKDEVLIEPNKMQWRISTQLVGDSGYTFRQYHSVCFADYINSCILGARLKRWNEDTAFMEFFLDNRGNRPDILQMMTYYLERMAKTAGMTAVLTESPRENLVYMKELDYIVAEGMTSAWPDKVWVKKDLK